MSKKDFKRINLMVEPALCNQIEKKAAESYLKNATNIRQLIQQEIKITLLNN